MIDADWLADKLPVTFKIPEAWDIVPTVNGLEPGYEDGFYYQTFTRSQFQSYFAAVQAARGCYETPTAKACMELLFKLPQPTG